MHYSGCGTCIIIYVSAAYATLDSFSWSFCVEGLPCSRQRATPAAIHYVRGVFSSPVIDVCTKYNPVDNCPRAKG
ncbi:hypothetical protein EDD16DRAFT_1650590 [Pisolithus croceorrhizus]|nr:hypothetical protein EDD16DRAFT_1650590 [Pisolithus croceorrhizus]KAI6156146.1 hypothetical protein EDD17DRAFT_1627588 [Pisolithus thermaeus]